MSRTAIEVNPFPRQLGTAALVEQLGALCALPNHTLVELIDLRETADALIVRVNSLGPYPEERHDAEHV